MFTLSQSWLPVSQFSLVTDDSFNSTTSPSDHVSLKTDINYASGEHTFHVTILMSFCWCGRVSLTKALS